MRAAPPAGPFDHVPIILVANTFPLEDLDVEVGQCSRIRAVQDCVVHTDVRARHCAFFS